MVELKNKSVEELKKMASKKKIVGRSKMNKAQLVRALSKMKGGVMSNNNLKKSFNNITSPNINKKTNDFYFYYNHLGNNNNEFNNYYLITCIGLNRNNKNNILVKDENNHYYLPLCIFGMNNSTKPYTHLNFNSVELRNINGFNVIVGSENDEEISQNIPKIDETIAKNLVKEYMSSFNN